MTDVLLIYPRLGSFDSMIVDLPLSILYAATECVKRGYSVDLVDMRIEKDWRATLAEKLRKGVRLAGISVMTGTPLHYAREISRIIRAESPSTPIVWGGPHPTVLPETIEEDFVDYLVRGYGSLPLAELTARIRGEGPELSAIPGLSYKKDNAVFHNDRPDSHEIINHADLPYHLLDVASPHYSRSYSGHRMFPIFTAIGCPYRCSFCVHPKVYEVINGPKWRPIPMDEVLDHVDLAMKRYGADHIVFIDDTSFPDLPRMKGLFDELIRRDLGLTLEFRGARVNEIDRMDDEFLEAMVKAGTRVLMVGVESGSDRVLKNFQKGISKEQILRVNRKLARYPLITPHYNFIYGTPGETYEDLLETKDLVLTLIKENPNAYFGFGGDWKPIPGTKTLQIAEEQYGYVPPKTMDDWIQIDSSDAKEKIVHPWYTPAHNNLIKLMQVASFVIDDKIIKESKGNNSLRFRIFRLMSRVYKPVALFRMKHALHQFPVEYEMWRMLLSLVAKLSGSAGA